MRGAGVQFSLLAVGQPGEKGTTVDVDRAGQVAGGRTGSLGAGEYLTGVQDGWHAIAPDALKYAAATSNGVWIVPAECGALVRLAPKFGPYVRDALPVMHAPCPPCAWSVAVATGGTDREIALILDDDGAAAALRRLGLDPELPARLCRAILAATSSGDPAGQAVIRQLAAVSAHAPGLSVGEECAEGGCHHKPCSYPSSRPVCWACSLRAGEEAGEWAGSLMSECAVTAPCGVLTALAVHYRQAIGR